MDRSSPVLLLPSSPRLESLCVPCPSEDPVQGEFKVCRGEERPGSLRFCRSFDLLWIPETLGKTSRRGPVGRSRNPLFLVLGLSGSRHPFQSLGPRGDVGRSMTLYVRGYVGLYTVGVPTEGGVVLFPGPLQMDYLLTDSRSPPSSSFPLPNSGGGGCTSGVWLLKRPG